MIITRLKLLNNNDNNNFGLFSNGEGRISESRLAQTVSTIPSPTFSRHGTHAMSERL